MTAIKKLVFDEKSLGKDELIAALDADFEGYEALRHRLIDCPKMGKNEKMADDIACRIMKTFAEYVNNKPNDRGGIYRAGTGSAMEYVWSAAKLGATADGRRANQPYASSFSPSLTAKINTPLSTIQSFTKFDMTEIINGGPLTMEVHDTVFRNEDGTQKVASLVQIFVKLGGHQLQINAVNREKLLDAREYPENYSNLIVRVWGWSGYFNELDPEFQDHIIKRTEFIA